MRTHLSIALAATLVVPTAFADEGASVSTEDLLSRITLGKTWYGPDLKVEDLKGRVVLIEFWGQH